MVEVSLLQYTSDALILEWMQSDAIMGLTFEWDVQKAQENSSKHETSFEESSTIFQDPMSLTISDPAHSIDEQRLITMGSSLLGRVLVVVHAERGDNIRIISARPATPRERRADAEGIQ